MVKIKLWMLAAVAALAIAAVLWLLLRGEASSAATSAEPTTAVEHDVRGSNARAETALPKKRDAHRDVGRGAPTSTSADEATSAAAAGTSTAAAAAAGTSAARRDALAPPPTAREESRDSDTLVGKFTDKTGWNDGSAVKQLNKEFMPLASECIEQAKARTRGLRGMLSFTMGIAPTENGRAIVASIKPRPDNQIVDPELFECVRESSFALEGLKAPHDFDITMPIEPQ